VSRGGGGEAVWKKARRGQMKIAACGKGRKGGARFPNPTYMHQLTDEYRRARNVCPTLYIFIG
jgi:hypothetical protein